MTERPMSQMLRGAEATRRRLAEHHDLTFKPSTVTRFFERGVIKAGKFGGVGPWITTVQHVDEAVAALRSQMDAGEDRPQRAATAKSAKKGAPAKRQRERAASD